MKNNVLTVLVVMTALSLMVWAAAGYGCRQWMLLQKTTAYKIYDQQTGQIVGTAYIDKKIPVGEITLVTELPIATENTKIVSATEDTENTEIKIKK